MTSVSPWCCVAIDLTPEEIAQLNVIPDGAHIVDAVRPCEIQKGHDGPHMTLGQTGAGDQEWWLLWDVDGLREIRVLPP